MQHILMDATRRSRVGVLREGKWYSVPDDVAEELDEGSYRTEAAVRSAPEHAARRTGGVPSWPLKTPPAEYLDEYGEDAPKSELAKTILGAEEADDA